jgi:hypothetical protein
LRLSTSRIGKSGGGGPPLINGEEAPPFITPQLCIIGADLAGLHFPIRKKWSTSKGTHKELSILAIEISVTNLLVLACREDAKHGLKEE